MRTNKCVTLRLLFLFCLAFSVAGCSLPSLEKPQCKAARDTVKRFYSLHFADDMRPSAQNVKTSQPFLTPVLFQSLSTSNETAKDYFTQTDDYPKAFRVGSCSSDSDTKAVLQVVLLWRDDNRTEQKEVHVETVKVGGQWLINNVSN
jgi:hypothetical protein